ncbi:MAG TPA: lasso RiPP family leader peptide-containing protein [Candidatus Acidoferrales bacterium]|nr:lasso RiPP family leader peptide-containing protein [Candidatus Acidoferrales bacterium]
MHSQGKDEPKRKTTPRASYSPPRLTEYGSLARLVRVKNAGVAHDPAACLNTKTSSPT